MNCSLGLYCGYECGVSMEHLFGHRSFSEIDFDLGTLLVESGDWLFNLGGYWRCERPLRLMLIFDVNFQVYAF